MAAFQLLQRLPEELLQDVLERLTKSSLKNLDLASHWCYEKAAPLIWRELELTDCRFRYPDGTDDIHDDTPMLRKLVVLAKNPLLASAVQNVTYRCHLPPPAIFGELPINCFSGQTLSPDPRTTALVRVAVKQMTNVHTLRIIFGHPNINDALLRCFFDKNRERKVPLRRLWLENCRLSAGCDLSLPAHVLSLPLNLDFEGLESIRLRRMPIREGILPGDDSSKRQLVHCRGGKIQDLQNGAGGLYRTTISNAWVELQRSDGLIVRDGENAALSFWTMLDLANTCDDLIYQRIAAEVDLPEEVNDWHIPVHSVRSTISNRGAHLDPLYQTHEYVVSHQRERLPSQTVMLRLLQNASATITSLCLDWILTRALPGAQNSEVSTGMFADFFSLRFPHLKAFQFRNAVVNNNTIPEGLCLLDRWRHPLLQSVDLKALEFMEAHPKLQCLAWPMDAFFCNEYIEQDIAHRVATVIDNLGRTLIDLRVDMLYRSKGEFQTENFDSPNRKARDRRRQFIARFAPMMTKLESIKIEGGIPKDERRETIRALHSCPLKKIVMIGVCSPIGNTWGEDARDISHFIDPTELDNLEGEPEDAIFSLAYKRLEPPADDFAFNPTYGWPPAAPMIHTLASFHANTITELKFCGYKGAPVLFQPTRITHPLLYALKYFHKLESLVMSMWLGTAFENQLRDDEIIRYWLNTRNSSSKALVNIHDEEAEGWERELRTKFAPKALAWEVTRCVGPHVSPQAKTRKGGVHVRASMCIGHVGGIFDIDLQIGKGSFGDVCLGFQGPREEAEPDRRRTKLDSRRWF